jgi:molybdopterin synthase catalytic subunit
LTAVDPVRDDIAVTVALTTDPLDVGAAHAAVTHPEAGGIGIFTGVVRNHHAGAAVDHLEYEAWEERAEGDLRAVTEQVAADFPGVRAVYAVHRLGRLEVGDVAVVCAASAPHRDEALAAASALIDRIKATVPIWKRETLTDGTVRWPACDDGVPG